MTVPNFQLMRSGVQVTPTRASVLNSHLAPAKSNIFLQRTFYGLDSWMSDRGNSGRRRGGPERRVDALAMGQFIATPGPGSPDRPDAMVGR